MAKTTGKKLKITQHKVGVFAGYLQLDFSLDGEVLRTEYVDAITALRLVATSRIKLVG